VAADEACYSLLGLGSAALPLVMEALRSATSSDVRLRLAQVIAHSHTAEALPWLTELLDYPAPDIWKTALDGLVMVADDALVCSEVSQILTAAKARRTNEVGMDHEAIGQVQPPEPNATTRETGEPG